MNLRCLMCGTEYQSIIDDQKDRIKALYEMTHKTTPRHELLLAAILLSRDEPLSAHHAGAIRGLLGYLSDDEIKSFLVTGEKPL